jgi:hypothetical protein
MTPEQVAIESGWDEAAQILIDERIHSPGIIMSRLFLSLMILAHHEHDIVLYRAARLF